MLGLDGVYNPVRNVNYRLDEVCNPVRHILAALIYKPKRLGTGCKPVPAQVLSLYRLDEVCNPVRHILAALIYKPKRSGTSCKPVSAQYSRIDFVRPRTKLKLMTTTNQVLKADKSSTCKMPKCRI